MRWMMVLGVAVTVMAGAGFSASGAETVADPAAVTRIWEDRAQKREKVAADLMRSAQDSRNRRKDAEADDCEKRSKQETVRAAEIRAELKTILDKLAKEKTPGALEARVKAAEAEVQACEAALAKAKERLEATRADLKAAQPPAKNDPAGNKPATN